MPRRKNKGDRFGNFRSGGESGGDKRSRPRQAKNAKGNNFGPPSIKDIQQPSKNWSFQLKTPEEKRGNQCDYEDTYTGGEGYDENLNRESRTNRRSSLPPLYGPQVTERYQSQYLRYFRALSLVPSAIFKDEPDPEVVGKTRTRYLFKSCDSPTGYWEVIQTRGFIDAGEDIFEPFKQEIFLSGSSDEITRWRQVGGEMVTLKDPLSLVTFFERDGTLGPYRFRLESIEDPTLWDEVDVYTSLQDSFDLSIGRMYTTVSRSAPKAIRVVDKVNSLSIGRMFLRKTVGGNVIWTR